MDYTVRDVRLKELGFENYKEYLRGDLWKHRRAEFLLSIPAPEVCRECRVLTWACKLAYGYNVNVHHLTYDRLGAELPDDLALLCIRCHELHHFGKTEWPKIILHACVYCNRPKIFFDPPINETIDEFADFQVNNIVKRMFSEKPIVRIKITEKLLEVMHHPSCFSHPQREQLHKQLHQWVKDANSNAARELGMTEAQFEAFHNAIQLKPEDEGK